MSGFRALAIGAVLLVGALLRAQDLNQPWVGVYAWREADNASIADAFAAGDWNILLPLVRWGGPGPNCIGAELQLVTWLTALGYRVFGAHPWVGRSVTALFGLLGLFVLYR